MWVGGKLVTVPYFTHFILRLFHEAPSLLISGRVYGRVWLAFIRTLNSREPLCSDPQNARPWGTGTGKYKHGRRKICGEH